ncbi:phage associated protein [Bifidobacterium sp. DSM 109957]|uniref:Phage associated protein n=1 Tax=Bifidobacterium oedipodis TaxID=2675322 RepID=A0A7Y0ERF7_9BIFI|nr:phage associated protein [Bifidobacterium sp. DSM 109957]
MKVLIPIKPQYAEQILDGTKLFEYRRRVFKRSDVTSLVIYESAPVGLITGEVQITGILSGPAEELWKTTGAQGGISKENFMRYFRGCTMAYAIQLMNPKRYDRSLALSEVAGAPPRAPQSFKYLDDMMN